MTERDFWSLRKLGAVQNLLCTSSWTHCSAKTMTVFLSTLSSSASKPEFLENLHGLIYSPPVVNYRSTCREIYLLPERMRKWRGDLSSISQICGSILATSRALKRCLVRRSKWNSAIFMSPGSSKRKTLAWQPMCLRETMQNSSKLFIRSLHIRRCHQEIQDHT